MRLSLLLAAAPLAAALTLTGCKPVGPDYTRPGYHAPEAYKETGAAAVAPPNPNGGSWSPASPSDGMLRGKWWEVYQDPQLNALEEHIASNNYTLKQASETYLAAHALIASTRSGLFPTVSAGPSIERDKLSKNRPSSSTWTHYNEFTLSGAASWEPDFWGRIRRSVEASRANAQASAADLATVDLSLHAELASDYFTLRGTDAAIRLLNDTLDNLTAQLKLTEQRQTGGVATEVDVAQAKTQLETVRAQRVDLDNARAQTEHAIATLIGQNAAGFALTPAPLEAMPPQIPLGVPSQILERRPDIAAAERRTAAANAEIGVAISAYYPSISLGALGGFESTHSGNWLTGPSTLWTLGASASETLFDAGKRHALTDQSRHLYEAQAAAYRATVLDAFNDVEDQLAALRVLEQESKVEHGAVASAQRSLDLSKERYQGGVTSYLEVLTAETTLLTNQKTEIDLKTRQFLASVHLIRALGGGWDATQLPQ